MRSNVCALCKRTNAGAATELLVKEPAPELAHQGEVLFGDRAGVVGSDEATKARQRVAEIVLS